MGKSTPEVWTLFERLTGNSQQWDFNYDCWESSQLKKRIYEVQGDLSLNAQLYSLTRKVDALVMSQTMKVESQVQHDACNMCTGLMHNAMVCPSLENQESISKQGNVMNQFRKSFNSPYSKLIILIGRITLTFLRDNHNLNLNLTK